MSPEFYQSLHVFGILLLFTGLVGLWGVYSTGEPPPRARRMALAILHGLGLLLIAISGLARAGQLGLMAHLPLWIYVKFAIWLALGASLVLAKRKTHLGVGLLILWLLLGLSAICMGFFKPF